MVAGYDEKALNWDEEKARMLKSQRLGWQATVLVDSAADIRGNRAITLQLSDQDQQPITGAQVELTAFHRARVANKQQIELSEINDGVYAGQLQVNKGGNWQFDGSATRGDDTLLLAERVIIGRSKD